jgi:hypothetical protein
MRCCTGGFSGCRYGAADRLVGETIAAFGISKRFNSMIRKLKSGDYRLYSRKKGSDGKRKNLGTFSSRAAAEKHEREIQGFKHR